MATFSVVAASAAVGGVSSFAVVGFSVS